MNEPEKPAPSAVSFFAWGAFMLACAVFWASTTSYEGPFIARGCLLFGLASFVAGWARRRRHPAVAFLILAAGLGGCAVSGWIGVTDSSWFMGNTLGKQTKGNLGSLRSALSIYYGDLEGSYPPSLESLTENGKYLTEIPPAQVPGEHPRSAAVLIGKTPDDAGGWLYNNDPLDANVGTVTVNCTHTDAKGSSWASY